MKNWNRFRYLRALVPVLAVLVGFTGCALPAGSAESSQPLRGYITGPQVGGLSFYINKPAHVALFEVVPGRGAGLVYPRPGLAPPDGFTNSGRLIPHLSSRYDRPSYQTAGFSSRMQEPRMYLLIASERPLDLESFGPYGMRLAHNPRLQMMSSLNAYHTMEELAMASLPSHVVDGSWTTDVYVHWPEVIASQPTRGYVRVECGGYQMFVRLEYLTHARATLCTQEEPGEASPTPPRPDSSNAVIPQRRAPETRTAEARTGVSRAAISEQIRSSAQLVDQRDRPAPDAASPALRQRSELQEQREMWQAEARARRAEMDRRRETEAMRSGASRPGTTMETDRRRTPARPVQPTSPGATTTRTPAVQSPPRSAEPTRPQPAPSRRPKPEVRSEPGTERS